MIDKVFAFFRLIRWFNVLITGVALVLFQHYVINVNLKVLGYAPTMLWYEVLLMALSVMCIMAAGNVINDYFDFQQDKKFKPERVVLGKYFSLDQSLYIIGILNAIGIGLAFYLSWLIHNLKLANVFLLSAILLWQYSATLKKYPLIGNLIIALLCALVFAIPVLFEPLLLNPNISAEIKNVVLLYLKGYAGFAFLTTIIREIVKDVEDMEADKSFGYNTLPVAAGLTAARILSSLLVLVLMACIGFVMYLYWNGGAKNHFWYAALFLQFPLLVNVIPLTVATNKVDFRVQSVILKLVMVFGILTLPLFHYFSK